MSLSPRLLQQYHVFLASPGDVDDERRHVRRFFDDFNQSTAHVWKAHFQVVDWENHSTIGVGRPQELITKQTLEKHRKSLVLVIGIMGQRFGSPSGKAESGTAEEFDWAMRSHGETGFPEIKWFFRKTGNLVVPEDPEEAIQALEQWKKVRAFKQRMQDLGNPVFYIEYPGTSGFVKVFDQDLRLWLADSARPWVANSAGQVAAAGVGLAGVLPTAFDSHRYAAAIQRRFDRLNFEMLDTTGAFYSGVRLWNVFVPQSARECHEYNPRLLEISKEHQHRLLKAGDITAQELAADEKQAEALRREYFQQPLRSVLDVVSPAVQPRAVPTAQRLVILGDPGAGKSSLIRYLAVRWATIADSITRDTQPIPLVIDLGSYSRWKCDGRKSFVRFLEEAPGWYEWQAGVLAHLLRQPDRVILLLDGLDEVFDPKGRDEVTDDVHRFCNEYPLTPIVMTSRVIGFQPHRLRDAEFRQFMLQDLDEEQVDVFIDQWHDQTFDDAEEARPKRERLKTAIRGSKSIGMLAGNPLLLTMMAILNRNQELPRDRLDLYSQASRLLLQQWDTERALADFPGLNAEIGWREKSEMLRRVASFMQSGPGGLKGNLIDGVTLTSLIEEYLRSELRFEQSRAAARAVVEHLRKRNFILCFVGADSYGFVHRTFLEYFCASEFAHRFNIAKTLDEQRLIALFDDHCRDDDWREVLRLICCQIDEQFVGRVIEHLVEKADLGRWDGKRVPLELSLAIWCLSEARSFSRLETPGSTLLQAAIQCFLRGDSPSDARVIELTQAAAGVGTRWPGKSSFAFANQHPMLLSLSHCQEWPRFLAVVFDRRSWIEQLTDCPIWSVRSGSFEVLAETWPDHDTRVLLAARATNDPDEIPRVTALSSLTEIWPDESTRALVSARAVDDPDLYVNSTSVRLLVMHWPDETTRTLLTSWAVDDGQKNELRDEAIGWLKATWPDETSQKLLASCASVVGYAACEVAGQHSAFGALLFSSDLDGLAPFLDPLRPVPDHHIKLAAKRAALAVDAIEETVRSLSAHMGWDITRGSRSMKRGAARGRRLRNRRGAQPR
jgi:hypothetical protein